MCLLKMEAPPSTSRCCVKLHAEALAFSFSTTLGLKEFPPELEHRKTFTGLVNLKGFERNVDESESRLEPWQASACVIIHLSVKAATLPTLKLS